MGLRSWFRRRRLDQDDFEDEIRAHLAIAAEDKIADGAGPREARLASLKDFGNVTLTTEAARRVWTPWWVDAVHDQNFQPWITVIRDQPKTNAAQTTTMASPNRSGSFGIAGMLPVRGRVGEAALTALQAGGRMRGGDGLPFHDVERWPEERK